MIKNIFIFFICLISVTSHANTPVIPPILPAAECPDTLPTDDVNFCASFKASAVCNCTSLGLPSSMCQNVNALYNRMISTFGSLQKACEYQHYTTTRECIDNWNCYRNGGVDSYGRMCSGTKMPCQ